MNNAVLKTILALLLCTLVQTAARADDAAKRPDILVFAAASLTDVLQQIGTDYRNARGQVVKFSFGSSATLARQIEAGATPDLFISADEDWMDYLDQRNLINRGSRKDLLANKLVLVSPAQQPVTLRIAPSFALKNALGASGRLAVGDPASVPAGKYAKAALTSLKVWDEVATRLAPADNVRMALLYVSRGEAPLGIVYLTDAKAEPSVKIVDEFPEDSHPPIRYPAALTSKGRSEAGGFLEWLRGTPASARFSAAGFQPMGSATAAATGQACSHESWDMGAEATLFKGKGSAVRAAMLAPAGGKQQAAPTLAVGTLYSLTLATRPDAVSAAAAAPGEKPRHARGAFGGRAQFRVPRSGRYRVTTDAPFWIDVLAGSTTLKATAFHGWHDCALFRKSVEYDLARDTVLTLQLSGAEGAQVRVGIEPSTVTGSMAAH